jgi:hypothetical protein
MFAALHGVRNPSNRLSRLFFSEEFGLKFGAKFKQLPK